MDRTRHRKYFPECPRNIALVNQYMWKNKDSNKYHCHNGISHPIYDCSGNVNFSLPLNMYPPVNQVHPQILRSNRLHLNNRNLYM